MMGDGRDGMGGVGEGDIKQRPFTKTFTNKKPLIINHKP